MKTTRTHLTAARLALAVFIALTPLIVAMPMASAHIGEEHADHGKVMAMPHAATAPTVKPGILTTDFREAAGGIFVAQAFRPGFQPRINLVLLQLGHLGEDR